MKLTAEQLDLIDCYLEQKDLNFLDIKLELKDHIACEIEGLMVEENVDFYNAANMTLKKWNSSFSTSKNSWIINTKRTFPNIVYNKLKNTYILINSVFVFFIGFVLLFTDEYSEMNHHLQALDSLKILLLFIAIVYFILFVKIKSRVLKTTFLFNFQHLMFLNYSFFVIFFLIDGLAFLSIFALLLLMPFTIYNFQKHQQFIKKYHLI
jgi:hypothetical protein